MSNTSGRAGDRVRVELGVVDEHDDEIGGGQLAGFERHQGCSTAVAFTSGMWGSQKRTSAPLAANRSATCTDGLSRQSLVDRL